MRATTGDTNVFPLSAATGAAGAAVATAGTGSVVTGGGSGAGAAAAGNRLGCALRLGGLRLLRGRCRSGSGRADLRAGRRDERENGPDLHRLTLLHEDLCDDSLGGARHLGIDLVRRDLEQRLVPLDRLADLAEPLRDRSLGHGDAHLGHHDLGLHSCRHRSSRFVAAQ